MTSTAAAPTPALVRIQVCGECLPDLRRRGAVHVRGPHAIALDTRCEAHGRTGALAAAHVVDIAPELLEALEAEHDAKPIAPLEDGDDIADAQVVATLAVSFMGAHALDPTDDAIAVAVRTARRILDAARGK